MSNGKRVAIVGAGPGGVSAALALLRQGYDVSLFERHSSPKPLGGAVLLSVPVLAVLRYYGISMDNFGSKTSVTFQNHKGKVRAKLPANPKVEESFGLGGWHYGVLRKSAFGKMLERLPDGVLKAGRSFCSYSEHENGVTLHFDEGDSFEADILIGADGVNSVVSRQTFGDPGLFFVGTRIWLAWCHPIEGLPFDKGVISHSHKYQASYFPMLHEGKQGFEWWLVEPREEHSPEPENRKEYLQNILKHFADPMPRFLDATDLNTQIFPWDVYNRASLKSWSAGRVVCLGDAVHPVSPYAAYGMGMAIEDGYFLAKHLAGTDLTDANQVTNAFRAFEDTRLNYVNNQVEFARKLGDIFHKLPYPLAKLRDLVFDHTPLLSKMMAKESMIDQEKMSLSMTELHLQKAVD